MLGPCAKQVVTATIISPTGERFVGDNYCRNAQPTCPRGDLPTGVGYEMCADICQQVGHAEVNALAAAGEHARGARLYLEGHNYACQSCRTACETAGIESIAICPPPAA